MPVTLNNINLMFPAYVGSSAASIFANPSGKTTFVRGIILHNANTTTETVQIYFVANSSGSLGSAGATNLMYKLSLTADETLVLEIPFSFVMTGTNDAIFGTTTTASKVTVVICGDQGQ